VGEVFALPDLEERCYYAHLSVLMRWPHCNLGVLLQHCSC
jgi:hypothetical protein